MHTLFKKWVSHLIPSSCLLCDKENHALICHACTTQFFSPIYQRCRVCALPTIGQTTHCGSCLKKPPAFDQTLVACDYVAPVDQLILALKFGHRLAVAQALGHLLTEAIKTFPSELPDLLIAVPLSHERLAERGFNQAQEIAKPFAKHLNRPLYSTMIYRTRHTHAQAMLHPDQRQKNMQRAFAIDPTYADKIRGQHIGVIDDVMTTGITLHEMANCLKKQGARRVSNFVVARTPLR